MALKKSNSVATSVKNLLFKHWNTAVFSASSLRQYSSFVKYTRYLIY